MSDALTTGGVILPSGVNLDGLELDDPDALEQRVLGIQKRGFDFRCPVCRKVWRNDARDMPVLCTGPHPSLSEHEPTLTVLVPGQT